jgi:hypothetical protein
MLGEQVPAGGGATEAVPAPHERNHLSLVGPSHLLLARSMAIADQFDESHVLVVVLDLLRSAGHDAVTVGNAVALASAHVDEHPRDLVGWRALGLLKRALVFLGGGSPTEGPGPTGDAQSGSRWAISNENAGRQIETYSAPSGDGVL